MSILNIILTVLFIGLSLLLILIALMQEGKGGGLGTAFGGRGGEAFGHGAGGINKFTTVLAGLLFVLAAALAFINTTRL